MDNKIKNQINSGVVNCYIRYCQAGNYYEYKASGCYDRKALIKEAKRWVWDQFRKDLENGLYCQAVENRQQNLKSIVENGVFEEEGQDAYLCYKLDDQDEHYLYYEVKKRNKKSKV